MTEDEIAVHLQGILDKNKSGTFCGGTLCISYRDVNGNDDLLFLNISNEKLRPDIRKLLAEIYLQYKTPDHTFWALAKEIMLSSSPLD